MPLQTFNIATTQMTGKKIETNKVPSTISIASNISFIYGNSTKKMYIQNETVKRKRINKDSLFSWYSFFLVVAYHLLFLIAALVCRYSGLNDIERVIPFAYLLPAGVTILLYLWALVIRRLRKRNPLKNSLLLYQRRFHWRAVGSLEGIVLIFSLFLVILLLGVFL